jgi:hypothetical protein
MFFHAVPRIGENAGAVLERSRRMEGAAEVEPLLQVLHQAALLRLVAMKLEAERTETDLIKSATYDFKGG